MNESESIEPTREAIDKTVGPVLLEFGTSWCPHCQVAAPPILAFLDEFKEVRHIQVEDGPGRPLGRSFQVKLWPTLVFLRDGRVVQTAVRPDKQTIREGFEAITG